MKVKHTQGPWKLIQMEPRKLVVRVKGPIVSGIAATISTDWVHPDQCEEQCANARLIAAAPLLLAALQAWKDLKKDYTRLKGQYPAGTCNAEDAWGEYGLKQIAVEKQMLSAIKSATQ